MNLGPTEIAIIAIVIFALFGYKKLPDASRAVGRSLRIFKGEMKGMKEDGLAPADAPRPATIDAHDHPGIATKASEPESPQHTSTPVPRSGRGS